MALSVGTRLGPYEVLGPLGAGGMGQVYRARDTRLHREVALKILSDALLESDVARKRFEHEARAVAALAHPNIVALYDVGREGGLSFAVSELLEGETLQDVLLRGPLPLSKVSETGAALADALAAAHAKGIVHRDVKPSNIFMTRDGRVKLLDFGLAKQSAPVPPADLSQSPTESQTQPGVVLGTLGYMSPEQARGAAADARSDIFALGCVLYEMVTGERAFARGSAAETLSAVLRDEPRALRDAERFPEPLRGIVCHCLEKHPEQRFQSVRDLAFALRSAAGVQVAEPRPRLHRPYVSAALAAVAMAAVVLALALGGVRSLLPTPAASPIESIAVLPLRNLSGDPEQEYFADGLTEALITDLAKARSLKVISHTSVLPYKNARKPLPEIARALNVQALIEGSVQRAGDRVRVTAQLIEASTDRHLWAEEYDRDLRDVLSLQREIARAVVREVHVAVTPQEETRLGAARRVVPESHEAYLKGRFYVSRFTEEAIVTAIGLFEKAIALDPSSAEAHAGLAKAHVERGIWGAVSPRETAQRARAAVARALALDDSSAESHATLAMTHEIYDWDWSAAEREFRRALELGGGEAYIHQQYATFLHALKRFPEAITESERARRLDPLSAMMISSAARVHYRARQHDRALDLYKESIALDPAFGPNYARLADVYLALGRLDEALAALERGREIGGETRRQNEGFAVVFAALGRRKEAGEILSHFRQMAAQGSDQVAYRIALIEMALGHPDAAIDWLERAYRERSASLWLVNPELKFEPLRADPRFQSLLKRMNYPPS